MADLDENQEQIIIQPSVLTLSPSDFTTNHHKSHTQGHGG
jgi:hypothetical protein